MLSPASFRFWKRVRDKIRVKHHRLMEIEIRGLENLRRCMDQKQGILITPNHSCHADPSVLSWVADQLKTPFCFMATWQIFQRAHWLRVLVLRQHGCFSVDRDGTRRAIIEFGEPIPVDPTQKGRNRTHKLTQELECRVQALLDGIQPE